MTEALKAAEQRRVEVANNPEAHKHDDGNDPIHPVPAYDHPGMTLRQYYAGQALIGFQAFVRGGWVGEMPADMADNVAGTCFALADAMVRRA